MDLIEKYNPYECVTYDFGDYHLMRFKIQKESFFSHRVKTAKETHFNKEDRDSLYANIISKTSCISLVGRG
ncbi:hypothetical protein GCM10023261_07300 [Bartonella jaculi]|uniref:Uncharacterized protein n=1 Tax=Bartonella jaculi TaxID=686226 RepID=A0ABP9N125_9HYPH